MRVETSIRLQHLIVHVYLKQLLECLIFFEQLQKWHCQITSYVFVFLTF